MCNAELNSRFDRLQLMGLDNPSPVAYLTVRVENVGKVGREKGAWMMVETQTTATLKAIQSGLFNLGQAKNDAFA
jgi:hypothetical protein